MKSSFLIIAALLVLSIQPASAMSTDHDSAYATASGGSRFSDPDDQLDGNQFGMVQLGNSSAGDSSGGVAFGISGTSNGQANLPPGYAMQGCLAASCQH